MATRDEILPQDSIWHSLALLAADCDQVTAELEKSLAADEAVWQAVARLINEEERREQERRERAVDAPRSRYSDSGDRGWG